MASIENQSVAPNGSRYAPSGVLVGGTRQRYFSGTYFKPHKVPKNAPTPTSQVHIIPVIFRDAVLGAFDAIRVY
jgi:hypothetical protein